MHHRGAGLGSTRYCLPILSETLRSLSSTCFTFLFIYFCFKCMSQYLLCVQGCLGRPKAVRSGTGVADSSESPDLSATAASLLDHGDDSSAAYFLCWFSFRLCRLQSMPSLNETRCPVYCFARLEGNLWSWEHDKQRRKMPRMGRA